MHTKYDFAETGDQQIVYVRPVRVSDLPADIQQQAIGKDHIYAVHDADGQRLALVKDRWMAFHLARENDMDAVNVH